MYIIKQRNNSPSRAQEVLATKRPQIHTTPTLIGPVHIILFTFVVGKEINTYYVKVHAITFMYPFHIAYIMCTTHIYSTLHYRAHYCLGNTSRSYFGLYSTQHNGQTFSNHLPESGNLFSDISNYIGAVLISTPNKSSNQGKLYTSSYERKRRILVSVPYAESAIEQVSNNKLSALYKYTPLDLCTNVRTTYDVRV